MDKRNIDAENKFPNDNEWHDECDNSERECEEYYKRKCEELINNYKRKYNECCDDSCREFYMKKIKECNEYCAAECLKCREKYGGKGPTGPTGPVGPFIIGNCKTSPE